MEKINRKDIRNLLEGFIANSLSSPTSLKKLRAYKKEIGDALYDKELSGKGKVGFLKRLKNSYNFEKKDIDDYLTDPIIAQKYKNKLLSSTERYRIGQAIKAGTMGGAYLGGRYIWNKIPDGRKEEIVNIINIKKEDEEDKKK